MTPTAIQHWLVPVVRQARLEGSDDLSIPADEATGEAWRQVSLATGLSASRLADVIARHFGLERAVIHPGALSFCSLLPASVATRNGLVPLGCSATGVTVATADPVGLDAEQEVARLTDRTVHVAVATPEEIRAALAEGYPAIPQPPVHDVGDLEIPEEPPRILVVDDEPLTRQMIRSILESNDFRVAEAANAREALSLAGQIADIQLVTLDLDLREEVGGLDVLKALRAQATTADLPVVVVTANEEPGVELELFQAGADDFLVKPVDPPRFLLRVQAVLRRYHGRFQSASMRP